jgi:hypothetical protein
MDDTRLLEPPATDPSATEPEDTEPQQETPPGRRTLRWPPWPPILVALAVTAVLIALAAYGPTHERRSTFVDGFGRQCTQVQKAGALALSCAPAPFEDRLADGLRSASERANGGGQ